MTLKAMSRIKQAVQLRLLCNRCSCRSYSSTASRRAGDVRIVEVGPRDGLQTEKPIALATKIELIRRLSKTGVKNIEAGSFVAPKWVPQMANSADVLNEILGHPPESEEKIAYNFLVPNIKGLENFFKAFDATSKQPDSAPITSSQNSNAPIPAAASPSPAISPSGISVDEPAPITSSNDPNQMPSSPSSSGSSSASSVSSNTTTPELDTAPATEISVFTAATEAFTRANTNCSIAESLERMKPVIQGAKKRDIRVRGYVSVALGCPYEGPNTSPAKVAEITATLLSLGADEVSVADTTGMGTAPKTQELLKTLFAAGIQPSDLALHFHDTFGQALVNAVVGLEHGIRTFDSSVGGLGGCPYSKGATGNVATEDLLHCLHSLGAKTGVDIEEMSRIGSWITGELGKANESRAGKAILARLKSS